MARFIVTDHTAAAHAVATLPTAARRLATVTAQVAEPLADLRAAAEPAEVLDALARWQRGQVLIDRARAEVLLLLSEAGASPRGLADALNSHRDTVTKQIQAAQIERGL